MRPDQILPAVFLFAVLIAPSYAAISSSSITVLGAGTAIVHSAETWQSGSDLTKLQDNAYTGGAAGHQTLLAPGNIQYQRNAKTDATAANVHISTGYVNFDNGGITADSVSMDDSSPNATDITCTAGDLGVSKNGYVEGNIANTQFAVGERVAMGQKMTVEASSRVVDADLTISGKANWTGAGTYQGRWSEGAADSATKNTSIPNYNYDRNTRFNIGTNPSGSMQVSADDYHSDFTDAFVTMKYSDNTTATEMYEEITNETPAYDVANTTEEA